MNPPFLVKAQVNHPFLLTTDASNTHISGVLSPIQSDDLNKPIGYFSKTLNPYESRYSATDKEAHAVVLVCRNFHHFLWSTRFTVITDHQPLTSIFKRKTKSPSDEPLDSGDARIYLRDQLFKRQGQFCG